MNRRKRGNQGYEGGGGGGGGRDRRREKSREQKEGNQGKRNGKKLHLKGVCLGGTTHLVSSIRRCQPC